MLLAKILQARSPIFHMSRKFSLSKEHSKEQIFSRTVSLTVSGLQDRSRLPNLSYKVMIAM